LAELSPKVVDNKDGSYKVSFKIEKQGAYLIDLTLVEVDDKGVKHKAQAVKGSPFKLSLQIHEATVSTTPSAPIAEITEHKKAGRRTESPEETVAAAMAVVAATIVTRRKKGEEPNEEARKVHKQKTRKNERRLKLESRKN